MLANGMKYETKGVRSGQTVDMQTRHYLSDFREVLGKVDGRDVPEVGVVHRHCCHQEEMENHVEHHRP